MARLAIVWLFIFASVPAWAAPGDPVVGQHVRVDRHVVGIRWDGTDEDAGHRDEAAMLGGFTLFASFSPGGPVIARLPFPWPPPPSGEEGGNGPPAFLVGYVPDGRYYVLVVRGIVDSPSPAVPASAWSELIVNVFTCGSPPSAPARLLGSGTSPGGSPYVSLGWSDGAGGCPPEVWQVVAGSAPGASDLASFRLPGRLFSGLAPPGTYYVRVHAVNRFGLSAPSNEVKIVVSDFVCSLPALPNLTATVVGNQVTLAWSAPDPGSQPISLYQIAVGSLSTHSNIATIRVSGSTTSFTTAAPPGRYFVRVHAGNGCGGTFVVGLPSNEVIIDVP